MSEQQIKCDKCGNVLLEPFEESPTERAQQRRIAELEEENARLRAELDQSERQVAVFQRSASDANLKVDELEQQLDATREALSLALVEVRSYLTELARHEDEKMNNPKGDREYLCDLLVASEETRQAILDSIKDERSMNNAKYDLVGTRLLKSIVATQVWLASQEPVDEIPAPAEDDV